MTPDTRASTAAPSGQSASVRWCRAESLLTDIQELLRPCEIVLDIGCGINPQKYVKPVVHICCEPFHQYVEKLQEVVAAETDRIYVVIKASWTDVVKVFPANSVDTVFLVDVVEHLEKEEGRRLLAQTEHIARHQVIVFTPLGYMPQHHDDGKDAWGLDGAAWQEHRSGWLPEEFDESWQILACKDFHSADNMGRRLEQPFGAFWAAKTRRESAEVVQSVGATHQQIESARARRIGTNLLIESLKRRLAMKR
jgi:hypothetical protein